MLNFTFKVLPFGSRSYLSAAGLYFWRRASGSGFKLSFLTFPVAHDCSATVRREKEEERQSRQRERRGLGSVLLLLLRRKKW